MDLKQMQYFLCLAEVGNVTRAARQLNIVQPALSMQVAKLEAEFGQRLFDRTAHGVATTVAGEALVRLLTPIVRDVEHARQEMARFDGRISGRVVAGLITSVAQSTLASSSARVAAQFPDVALSACEGYTETLMDWVTTGQLDLAIINVPKHRRGLNAHHILDEEMVFACRHSAPAPVPAHLTFAHLAQCDLVMPSKRHGLRMILEEQADAAGIELNPRIEIDTLSAICEVVATTDLVTVLPTIALHQFLAAGRVRAHHFATPRLTRSIAVVHHPRRSVSAAADAVVEVIRDDLVAAASSAARLVHPAGETGAPAARPKGTRRRAPARS
ncbi:LysR family transcriptional regulator [Xanthobacter sediminis]|uniref:LysR family transcriptional regulator n=1 Tax=Xanthobacter sediminis TaxID=3119926 RepID=UPI0037283C3A